MAYKLIFDEAAFKLIAEKLPGRPIYAGPDGGLFEPGIVDILCEDGLSGRWLPGNNHTRQLVLGAEACRDVLFYLNQFLESKTRRRAMNRMAVPICSLIDVVVKLLADTNSEQSRHIRESTWPRGDRDTYQILARRLKRMKDRGPVRRVRNKLAAHLDADVFVEKSPQLKPEDILSPLGDCVVLLMLSMNYSSEWFSWIRPVGILEDGKHLAVETMYSYPLCIRWITDMEGHVKDIGSMVIAADPRHELQKQFMETVASYNCMVKAVNSALPTIYTFPTDELFKGGLNQSSVSSEKADEGAAP
jgi:hypothetical protein